MTEPEAIEWLLEEIEDTEKFLRSPWNSHMKRGGPQARLKALRVILGMVTTPKEQEE